MCRVQSMFFPQHILPLLPLYNAQWWGYESLTAIALVNSMKHCLCSWKKWNLSLIGKIAVLKIFAFPKIVYPMTVLQNPDKAYIKSIQSIFYDFLWDSKPDKIARNLIIQDYPDGGLKMVDIESYMHGLKATWEKRLKFSNSVISKLYEKQLKNLGGDLIFKSNISVNNLQNIVPSQFLNDIIKAWALCRPNDTIPVSKQVLWNHSDICKSNGKPFYFDNWYQKGIQFLEHIYDFRSKRFYDFKFFSSLYDIPNSDFLKYHSLKSCISRTIKIQMELEEIVYTPPSYFFERINQNTKLCRYVYQTLIKQKAPNKINAQDKWKTTLMEDSIDWKNMYMKPIKLTNETKLREFQFKFLNRIVPNNSFLFKCKIASSNLCDFCNANPDSLEHMFWKCQHIQHFWTQFTSHILTPLNTNKNVCFKNIVWCNLLDVSETNNWIVNYLILIAKYFIFRSKSDTSYHSLSNVC